MFAFTFDINDAGQCRNLIEEAYQEIAALVLSHRGQELADRMNLCKPVDTESAADVAALYENSVRAVMLFMEDFQ